MNIGTNEFTLLSYEQTFGKQKIDVIRQMGCKCAISDFAILLGAYVNNDNNVDDDISLKGRTGWWYLSSSIRGSANPLPFQSMSIVEWKARIVSEKGRRSKIFASNRSGGIRPVLPYSKITDISSKVVKGSNGILEVEYGEYPQYAVDPELAKILDNEFLAGKLKKTGKTYTTDSRELNEFYESFSPIEHEEFEYNGKRYIKVESNFCDILSNGIKVMPNDIVWLEVSPIVWYVDEKEKMLISKTLLASGIRCRYNRLYDENFKNTEMYMFLNTYFAKDITPTIVHEMTPKEKVQSEEDAKQVSQAGTSTHNQQKNSETYSHYEETLSVENTGHKKR